MGDMWRSQKMTLVQMIVQNDAAHAVVNKLGQTGIVEFRDVRTRALPLSPCHPLRTQLFRPRASLRPLPAQLNAGTSFYKRSFVEEVRKCDELMRVLRGIADEYAASKITLPDKDEKAALALSLDDIEEKIHSVDEELTALKTMQEASAKPPRHAPRPRLRGPPSFSPPPLAH